MKERDKIIKWLSQSDLTEEQKVIVQNHFQDIQDADQLKDFQIKRLKDNLRINTRFLNKTVEDLEKTVNLLKDSNSQLDNFVKIASHDLKSPLRSISSFSKLLRRKVSTKLDEKEDKYFEIIESSTKAMTDLIEDLLLFTRINSEDLTIKEIKLSALLDQVLTNLNYDIEINKVKIECNYTAISIKCDPIKFNQVLQNLLSNSIKFSSYERNQPHIIFYQTESPTHWIFSIKDNGIGISEEFKEVAFQEFKKLNGDAYEGSGMGLSIVKKIVHKHQGDVWIQPSSEKGTTITFTIAKDIQLEEN